MSSFYGGSIVAVEDYDILPTKIGSKIEYDFQNDSLIVNEAKVSINKAASLVVFDENDDNLIIQNI